MTSPIATSVVAQSSNGIEGAIEALTLRPFVDGDLTNIAEPEPHGVYL